MTAPFPSIGLDDEARDPGLREPRARELAAWCDLDGEAAEAFVARYKASWLHQETWEARRDLEDLMGARLDRDLYAFWERRAEPQQGREAA